MKTTRHARAIGAFRSSGQNPRPQQQQPATQSLVQPSAPSPIPQRPSDAKTLQDGAAGMLRSAGRLAYVLPRFPDTRGSWVRVGEHQCRVPQNALVSVIRARDGREFGVIAGTNADDGRIWILADTADGVRELVGLPPGALADIRRVVLGR